MDDQLDTAAVAELAGVKPESIRQYHYHGTMPAADGYVGRSPWWRRRTIERWLATRPTTGWQHKPTSKASKKAPHE